MIVLAHAVCCGVVADSSSPKADGGDRAWQSFESQFDLKELHVSSRADPFTQDLTSLLSSVSADAALCQPSAAHGLRVSLCDGGVGNTVLNDT